VLLFRASRIFVRPGRDQLPADAMLVDGGRVVRVGRHRDLHCDADEVDLGAAAVLPGLVNAHTHLELSNATPGDRPASFGSWILGVARDRAAAGGSILDAAADGATRGAAECLAAGVTTVGDISRFPMATRPVLAASPLRVVSFGEVQAMAGRRHLLDERLRDATDLTHDGWLGPTRIRVGVSPHAPYSVEPAGYAATLAWARQHDRPLATHLAESPDEAEFLRDHAGPLRELWNWLGDFDENVPQFAGSPVAYADSLDLLRGDVPTLVAHGNFLNDADLARLASGNVTVAYCPRTHAYFGHPSHPMEQLLDAGVPVCLATDSRASSPDLDLLAEARHVLRDRPHLDATTLWPMLTTVPAAGLGVEADVGSLLPGRFADFFIVDDAGPSTPDVLLYEPLPISSVWSQGEMSWSAASPA
jgi:cytosine/adenosine deaminase-related metal-dependent hydrolase